MRKVILEHVILAAILENGRHLGFSSNSQKLIQLA
jgi:hypothetical protein